VKITWAPTAKLPSALRSARPWNTRVNTSRSKVESPAIFFTAGKILSATRSA
jgi:hypothetical protein